MGGLSIYCLGKHRHGCLAHHRTAQNNKCLNDKGGNTENNRTGCSSQGSAESRIPARPSPMPAPSLPVLGNTSMSTGGAGGLQLAMLTLLSLLLPFEGAFLPHSFARICCSGGSFSEVRSHPAQCLQSSPGYCQVLGMSQG